MGLIKNITKEDLELSAKLDGLETTYNFQFNHPEQGKLKANISGYVNDNLLKAFWEIEKKYNENIKGKWIEEYIKEIDITFSSYGGYCYTALQIIDFIRNWNYSHNVKINFTAQGMIASAGFLIFVMGERRSASINSHFMIHELSASYGYSKLSLLRDSLLGDKQLQEILERLILARTDINEDKLKEIMQHDYYLTAEQALELGVVHEII